MIVILTLLVQIIILILLAIISFVFGRNKFIRDGYLSIYYLTRYLMRCRLTSNRLALKDKLIITCNHPTNLDFIYLLHWAKLHDRLEDLRFVSKDSIGNIPFFGSYIKDSQCLISRNYEQDCSTIIEFCERLNRSERYILVVFPEGTTLCPETREKSFTYCKENDKPIFDYLLYPRYRGLELIFQYLQVQQWIDLTLFYIDDPNCYKCNYSMDILLDSYPRNAIIEGIEIYRSSDSLEKQLEELWIKKEKTIFLSHHPM